MTKTAARIVTGAALAIIAGGCFNFSDESSRLAPSYTFLPGHKVDWSRAKWISAADAPVPVRGKDGHGPTPEGTSVFFRNVENAKCVKKAVLSASGLGVFNIFVNGTRIGDEVLKPGFSHNGKTKYAFSYDVTPIFNKLAGATNSVSAMVSTGWWSDLVAGCTGSKSALIARLDVTYVDDDEEIVVTDDSWTAGIGGPVLKAGIFDGEVYDARRKSVDVKPAVVNDEFKGVIEPQTGASVYRRADLSMHPVCAYVWKGVTGEGEGAFGRVLRLRDYTNATLIDLDPGETLVLDFGQNAAAVPYFKAISTAGATVTLKPAEMLNDCGGLKSRGNDGPEGAAYRANLRSLKDDGAKAVYTFAGPGVESYMPQYTFFGYRYISVTATDKVKFTRFESIPVTSITREMECGSFVTGVPEVNKLVSNIRWGQLSNYLSVPTDCPQRDERQGWTADTQVFARAATYNADVLSFLKKFMRDMRDTQRAGGSFTGVAPAGWWGDFGAERFGWSDAGVIIPWTMWRQYGDKTIIDENWSSMERFMDWLKDNRYAKGDAQKFQWADWLSYEDFESCSNKHKNGRDIRPEAALYWRYLGACYWLEDARKMRKMASITGRVDAERKYAAMADEALAYIRRDVLEEGRIPKCLRNMQTPALFAIRCGILEDKAYIEEVKKGLLKSIADHGDCLQTGFLGTSILMDTITYDIEAPEVAYTLLLQHKNPSWLYSVDQGATTVWERWNSYRRDKGFGPVSMNSFNHYAYGSVLAWLYETAAGIQPGRNGGFDEEVILSPKPDPRLGFVRASLRNTKGGTISSEWSYNADGVCIWTFTIPEGTNAKVRINGKCAKYDSGTYSVVIK